MGFEPMNNGFAIRSESADSNSKTQKRPPKAAPLSGACPDLQRMIDAWPKLAATDRAMLLAMLDRLAR